MTKTRVLAGVVATVAVGAVIAGGVMFGVNVHNTQVAKQLEQERHAQAVATWSAIEANTVHTSGAAVDQAATVAGDQEAAQIAAQQAAAAKAAADAAAAQLAAQQAAQQAAAQKAATTKKTTTTTTARQTTTRSTTNTTDPTQPPAPIRCPAGSQAVSGDAGNDTSCLPSICFQIVLPDAAHPECDTPFKP